MGRGPLSLECAALTNTSLPSNLSPGDCTAPALASCIGAAASSFNNWLACFLLPRPLALSLTHALAPRARPVATLSLPYLPIASPDRLVPLCSPPVSLVVSRQGRDTPSFFP